MSLQKSGFEIIPNFISEEVAINIICDLSSSDEVQSSSGIRNIDKKFTSIHNLAHSKLLMDTANRYLNGDASLVRAILFNKSQNTNWLVSWHQDKTVALNQYDDSLKWSPWSIKDSIHHASPPQDVLETIITIRIHLDDSNIDNGCLKVIPKSHMNGILSEEDIRHISKESSEVFIEAPKLSALIMKPLLLHASSKALKPTHRRTLHLEYSSYELPYGLNWA